jgi:hypothetical protein
MLRSLCRQYFSDVSGQSVGPMFKGQADLDRQAVPEKSVIKQHSRNVTSKKTQGLNYNAPDAWLVLGYRHFGTT